MRRWPQRLMIRSSQHAAEAGFGVSLGDGVSLFGEVGFVFVQQKALRVRRNSSFSQRKFS